MRTRLFFTEMMKDLKERKEFRAKMRTTKAGMLALLLCAAMVLSAAPFGMSVLPVYADEPEEDSVPADVVNVEEPIADAVFAEGETTGEAAAGDRTAEAFVTRLYEKVLGRKPRWV